MADLQTLDTPAAAAASASTKKKHSKKRKAIDASLTDGSAADLQTLDTVAASASTKKHSKKRKAVVDASITGGSAADLQTLGTPASGPEPDRAPDSASAPASPPAIDVTVDASLTGGSTAAAAAPVVAYFPSGYDPLAAAAAGDDSATRTRLFRHEKHPNWVDFVVGSPVGGPDFVGRSYAGEAAAPQLCDYALGVLDKASGSLRVVPIAAKKILRLEPHLELQKPAHSQHSEVTSEAGSAAGNDELKIQDLTQMYGTKNDRDKDNKWKSLNEQRNDPSAYEDLDLGQSETNVETTDSQELVVRNIPPYDPTADTSEKAYLFDEIIPKSMRKHLLEIVYHFESGQISSKGYGSFVSNRVHKLQELQGEDKERFAWILSYITHLLSLYAWNGSMSKRHRKDRKENQSNHGPVTPQAVSRKLLLLFKEAGSDALSTEKNELLIYYILVLTLFADDFRSDPKDICADLKMTKQMLKPYYDQLGCKSVSTGAFQTTFMTLPAPLKFPQEVTRRKRRR